MALPDGDENADIELRCRGTLHAIIRTHHGIRCIEQKCHHIACTKGRAVSVFHYYSALTGDLVDTVTYNNDPVNRSRR